MERTKKVTVKHPTGKMQQGDFEQEATLQQILTECRQINANIRAFIPPSWQKKELLTLQEFCDYAGVTKSHAYYLTAKGLIRHFKPKGKLIYVDRKDAEEYIRQNEVKTATVLQDQSNNYIVNRKK